MIKRQVKLILIIFNFISYILLNIYIIWILPIHIWYILSNTFKIVISTIKSILSIEIFYIALYKVFKIWCLTLIAHLSLDQPHFKCYIVTGGGWSLQWMDSSDVDTELRAALASGILSELSDLSWNPNFLADNSDSVNCIFPFTGCPWTKEDLVKDLLTFGKDGGEQHSIKISVITIYCWLVKHKDNSVYGASSSPSRTWWAYGTRVKAEMAFPLLCGFLRGEVYTFPITKY